MIMKFVFVLLASLLFTQVQARTCGYVTDNFGNYNYVCVDNAGSGSYRYDNWSNGSSGRIRHQGGNSYGVQSDSGDYKQCYVYGTQTICY